MAGKAKFPKTVWIMWEYDAEDCSIRWLNADESPSDVMNRSGVPLDETTPIAEYSLVRVVKATKREKVDITG